MLAKANRLIRADDYRRLVRRGRRTATCCCVIYVLREDVLRPPRLGFIVSKAVGKAAGRNLVRRRLKSLGFSALGDLPPGTDVVIRALPGSAQADWDTLRSAVSGVLSGGVTRA